MPIIKAAIKDLRKSEKRRTVNRGMKTRLKEALKDLHKLASEKKRDEMAKGIPAAFALIDKAAKNHLIHNNNASRKKSRLSRMFAAIK